MAGIQELQQRFQKKVQESLEGLDKEFLRRMQASAFRCSVRCCENDKASSEDVQHCLTKCQGPVQEVQSFLEGELNNYQNRLQRCMMDCSDRVRDKVPANAGEAQMMKYREEAESCAGRCIDDHLGQQLPILMSRIRDRLKTFQNVQ